MTARLDVVLRGYDRFQVDRLLERLSREISTLKADLDAATARAEKAAEDLAEAQAATESARQSAQEASGHSLTSVGVRISQMLELAKQEAADISRQAREDVREQAEDICRQAREDAREQADVVRQLALEEQARSRRDVEVTARECASMRAEADEYARKIIEDAHEGARRELDERDQASRLDAKNRIRHAQEQSDNMLAIAEERVAGMEAQWAEVHTWLSRFRETMGAVPSLPGIPATSLSAPIVSAPRQILPPTEVPADRVDEPIAAPADAAPDVPELGREDVLAYRHHNRRRGR